MPIEFLFLFKQILNFCFMRRINVYGIDFYNFILDNLHNNLKVILFYYNHKNILTNMLLYSPEMDFPEISAAFHIFSGKNYYFLKK